MAAEAPAARALLEALVRALVESPDDVVVEDFSEDDGTDNSMTTVPSYSSCRSPRTTTAR